MQCAGAFTTTDGRTLYCMRKANDPKCLGGIHRFPDLDEVAALQPEATIEQLKVIVYALRGRVDIAETELELVRQHRDAIEELHRVEVKERLKSDGAMHYWGNKADKYRKALEKINNESEFCEQVTPNCADEQCAYHIANEALK